MPKYNSQKGIRLIWLIILLAFVLLAFTVILLVIVQREPAVQATEAAHTAITTLPAESAPATEDTAPTEPETTVEETVTAPAEPPQPGIEAQPDALTILLDQNSTTYEDLALADCSQLITVVANGTSANIRFYSCSDGLWQELSHLATPGYVGRGGVHGDKQEGDGRTPAGLYGIGSAFHIHDAPETALDLFQITADTYWVDDPDSVFYNKRVEGTENKDWDSAEHMISYDAYRYGFVVDYNPTAEYGAGSAIFFHIGDHPTAGCIATGESMVLAYLAELERDRNPCILIAGG